MNQKLISQVWGLVSADGAPLNETHTCDVSKSAPAMSPSATPCHRPPSLVPSICWVSGLTPSTPSPSTPTWLPGWKPPACLRTQMSPTPLTLLLQLSGVPAASACHRLRFRSVRWSAGGGRRATARHLQRRTVPAQYHCYLFGNGVVRTGQQFPLNIETERNIASLQDVFARNLFSNLHARHGHLLDL